VVSVAIAFARGLRRHPLLVVNALLLVGLAAPAAWRYTQPMWADSPAPADLFMQSVATEDGGLGWSQLCPDVQTLLPRDVLEQQTEMQRTTQSQMGVTLRIDHVGDRARPTGGEIRFYVATAHATDGSTGQKTYVVKTQASGCVESVN
jgi:hypothetical protein